jgi:hypothetical protein
MPKSNTRKQMKRAISRKGSKKWYNDSRNKKRVKRPILRKASKKSNKPKFSRTNKRMKYSASRKNSRKSNERKISRNKNNKSKQNNTLKNNKKQTIKLSPSEKKVIEYKKTHKLLRYSDFKNFKTGQKIHIAFIDADDKIHKFAFTFHRIEEVKGKLKKWYTYNIYGKSSYTQDLPLGVRSTGEIKFAESSDESPAYLDKPVVIEKNIKQRPSPSESATGFKVGTKKIGNDGNTWIIIETQNNTKRWKKM